MADFPQPEVMLLFQKLAETGELQPEDGIYRRVLSIHDHWLSEEEADQQMVSFAALASLPEYQVYLGEEDKFVRLFDFLFRNRPAFGLTDSERPVFLLESWSQLIDSTKAGLREQQPFYLYFGHYDVLLASAYDLNVDVYFRQPEAQPPFEDLARACQLHLLR